MTVLVLAYILFVPLLSRDLVGRDLALLLESYHVETFSILGLLAVLLGCPRLLGLTTSTTTARPDMRSSTAR
jgi:hypothetical protein